MPMLASVDMAAYTPPDASRSPTIQICVRFSYLSRESRRTAYGQLSPKQ